MASTDPDPVAPPKPSMVDSAERHLRQSLQQRVPPGRRAAIVVGSYGDGFFVGAAARFEDPDGKWGEWELAAELEAEIAKRPSAEFTVRWSK